MANKQQSSFICLSTGDSRWGELIDLLPERERDLHYWPEYLNIYKNTYPGKTAQNFVMENDDIIIFKPYIKSRINDLEFTKNIGEDLYDIESAYGYGGEVLISKNKITAEQKKGYLDEFQNEFAQFCINENIISEFCLLHPLLSGNQKFIEAEYRKEVVCSDLTLPNHALWRNIEERQRKGVALAKRKGVMVKRENLDDHIIDAFQVIYLKTMGRKEAGESWHFPDNYYKNCRDFLGKENVSLFNAYFEEQVIATFFLIHAHDTCYYHFAANEREFSKYNPTSLLLFETMMWAKAKGFKYYHMGGGLSKTGDDALFKFKYSFANKTFSVRQYSKIFNKQKYKMLCAEKQKFSGDEWKEKEGFFPAYRG